MAKLSGVKKLNAAREIECGSERYMETEGQAQIGDILRMNDDATDLTRGAYYKITVMREKVPGFADDVGDVRGVAAEGDHSPYDYRALPSWFTVYRHVPAPPQSPAEIRAAIEKKRTEIAELEAMLTVNVGDYVRVEKATINLKLDAGTIARVDKNDDSTVPYYLVSIVGGIGDWAHADAVTKITPAAAKAALIAQIEEAFESAS